MRKPPKRPRINRREANKVPPKSKRYMIQCKGCKEFGHNRIGCLVNPENSNKRTRLYYVSWLAFDRSFKTLIYAPYKRRQLYNTNNYFACL